MRSVSNSKGSAGASTARCRKHSAEDTDPQRERPMVGEPGLEPGTSSSRVIYQASSLTMKHPFFCPLRVGTYRS